MRSRCAESMPAWTLNTKALNGESQRAAGCRRRRAVRRAAAPADQVVQQLVHAEVQRRRGEQHRGGLAAEEVLLVVVAAVRGQQFAFLDRVDPSRRRRRLCASAGAMCSSGAAVAPPAVRVNRMKLPVRRSSTPLKSPAMPTGHVNGVGCSPMRAWISSSSSRASRPGRSHLLITVMIGMPRCRHTWNSLRVCGSRPFAASMSITAQSTALSTR